MCGLSKVRIKVSYPPYRPTWPRGVQEVRAPRFHDILHTKMVRSSPLRTGRLNPQEYPGTHILEAESTPGHMDLSDASEKVPSDTTGDRSRDLPTSSAALPQICTDVKDDLLYGYYIDCCFLFGVYDILWDNLLLRCLVVIVLTCFDCVLISRLKVGSIQTQLIFLK